MDDDKICRCKRGCATKLCGCRRKGRPCRESCKCNINVKCANKRNEDSDKENVVSDHIKEFQRSVERSKKKLGENSLKRKSEKFTFSSENIVRRFFIHSGLKRYQIGTLGLNRKLSFSDSEAGTDSDF